MFILSFISVIGKGSRVFSSPLNPGHRHHLTPPNEANSHRQTLPGTPSKSPLRGIRHVRKIVTRLHLAHRAFHRASPMGIWEDRSFNVFRFSSTLIFLFRWSFGLR